jgi:hypothetical protein
MSEKSTTTVNADSQPDPNSWTTERKTKPAPAPLTAGPPVWRSRQLPGFVPPPPPPTPTLQDVLEKRPPCYLKAWDDAIDIYIARTDSDVRHHEALPDRLSLRSHGGSDDACNMECYWADYYWTQLNNLRVRKEYIDWLKKKPS